MSDVEILPRVERRRKWSIVEKAALIAEVEAEGGKVKLVAQRHRVSESLLYNWRARPGRPQQVRQERLRWCRWASWAKRTPRHRRCGHRRNRHHRSDMLKPKRVRSRSPCPTAAVCA